MLKTKLVALMLALGVASVAYAGDETAASDAPKMNAPEACAACHGIDGNSPAGIFPNLAGQNARYLYLQLKDFKEGRRKDPMMSPMVASLEKKDMLALAQYFSEKKLKPISFTADNAKAAAGKKVADDALCPMCHLGGFVGQNEIPRVAGQQPDYVMKQLKDFRAKNRTNDAGSMTAYAGNLKDEEIENLVHYIATLN